MSNLEKSTFKIIGIKQTIFNSLSEIKNIELAINGYGEGAFVVINAQKER